MANLKTSLSWKVSVINRCTSLLRPVQEDTLMKWNKHTIIHLFKLLRFKYHLYRCFLIKRTIHCGALKKTSSLMLVWTADSHQTRRSLGILSQSKHNVHQQTLTVYYTKKTCQDTTKCPVICGQILPSLWIELGKVTLRFNRYIQVGWILLTRTNEIIVHRNSRLWLKTCFRPDFIETIKSQLTLRCSSFLNILRLRSSGIC